MSRKVYVIGVGMTAFEKPGAREDWAYPQMALEAGQQALDDAGVEYEHVEQAVAGYVYGDSTCGQAAVYGLGLSGIPVYNVNNNCATGASALILAKQMVEGGIAECTLAIGFEQMEKGPLATMAGGRPHPLGRHFIRMMELRGPAMSPPAPMLFGGAGQEHMERYGTTAEQFAKVAVKNHQHSEKNERAQFRDVYTLDQILESREIHTPITKLQCCPTSDGSAAAVLASEAFVKEHGLEDQAVEVCGMAMATDAEDSFADSAIDLIGRGMAARAANQVYEASGLGPENVDVIELHDCFSVNELITYEALGLCEDGQGGSLIDSGAVTYGGQWVVNPSGGLISKGHPLGATGLAQCAEINWQLRGLAGERQVEGASVGLQHNLGLGGACVVGMYRMAQLA
jgi:acetyl-CoA acetyltransferase